MAAIKDICKSMSQKDYDPANPVQLPAKPAPARRECPLNQPGIDSDDCKCKVPAFESKGSRYTNLHKIEELTMKELLAVNHARAKLVAMMLKSNCESNDETMKSIYQTDYEKKSAPIGKYRSLMAAAYSPTECPIEPIAINVQEIYGDSNTFRYSALEIPTTEHTQPLNLKTTLGSFALWNEPFSGQSEYMDTISKTGLSNMKNRQQYKQPHPSMRKKVGDKKC